MGLMLRFVTTVVICLLAATPALANEYSASRFDSRVEVLSGGALRVTETVVFTFTEGSFKQVFRLIPTKRTDGVEFVAASMDGRAFPQGEGPGHVRLRRKNGLRVEWNFVPVANSAHTFVLTYLARGVVREAADADLLEWQPLPREHDYRIGASRVEFVVPRLPIRQPSLDTRRVQGDSGIRVDEQMVAAHAADIARNGSFIVSVPLPRGSVLDGPPAWQARQIAQRTRMPVWLAAAGGITLAGLVVLFGLRQNYDRPPPDQGVRWASMLPPDSLPPAIAGALAANGRPRAEHAMGALFSLAERGVVTIREEPRRRFGQRDFAIERMRSSQPLAPHEETAFDIVFDGTVQPGATVSLSKARSRLARRWSRFKTAVVSELQAMQLIDHGRQASQRRFMKAGVILLVMALAAVAPCLWLVEQYGGWPFLIPLALAVVSTTSFIVMETQTPLSNEGVRRGEHWRAYQKHVASPQDVEARWGAGGAAEAMILPFVVALGVAAAWSKFMKKRNARTPAWFHAASDIESGQAFAVLIATGGATAHAGGTPGASGGGVAGGGASGAR